MGRMRGRIGAEVGLPALSQRSHPRTRRHAASLVLAGVVAAGQLIAVVPQVVAQALPTTTTPQLYVTPECLAGGETSIAVTGRNFDQNRSVDVWDLYDQTDPLYGNKVSTTSSEYGTLSVTLPINLHTPYWHRIEAVYSGDAIANPQQTLIVGGCYARITASPRCAGAPSSVAVALSNWSYPSSDPIVIDVVNIDTAATVAKASLNAPAASFTATIHFSSSTYPNGLPNGQYRISAHQGTDPASSLDAHTYLLVPCPTVTVTPNCAAPGVPPDQLSLDVTASGFINDAAYGMTYVEIAFDDGGSPQEFVGGGSSSDGTYQITPYQRGNGKYAVTVKQGYYVGAEHVDVSNIYVSPAWTGRRLSSATATFIAPCPLATPTSTPSLSPSPTATAGATPTSTGPTGPQLKLLPDHGPPGLVIIVIGSDFAPNSSLWLRWSRGIGAATPITVQTDAAGSFSRQVLIFNSDFLGPRQLDVTIAGSATLLLTPPPIYDVTPDTVSPPFSLADDPFVLPGATLVFRH
jgi:hypothetical protein